MVLKNGYILLPHFMIQLQVFIYLILMDLQDMLLFGYMGSDRLWIKSFQMLKDDFSHKMNSKEQVGNVRFYFNSTISLGKLILLILDTSIIDEMNFQFEIGNIWLSSIDSDDAVRQSVFNGTFGLRVSNDISFYQRPALY